MQRFMAGGPRPLELITLMDSAPGYEQLDIVPGVDPNLFTYDYEYKRTFCPLRTFEYDRASGVQVQVLVHPEATRRQISDACTEAMVQGIGVL